MMAAIKNPGMDWIQVKIDKNKVYEFISESINGFFELVPNFHTKATLYCDEEGKLKNLPINFPLLNEDNSIVDVVVGPVVMFGPTDEEGEETSLTDELFQETKKYFGG
jgi:hypothetical protein